MEGKDQGRKRRKKEKIENVGKYVKKVFKGYGVFIGKVVSFADGLYRVDYEDGDFEDLELHEVTELLMKEKDFDEEFKKRRKLLDKLIKKKQVDESKSTKKENVTDVGKDQIEASSSVGKVNSDLESGPDQGLNLDIHEKMDVDVDVDGGDVDSCGDSEELIQVRDDENAAPLIPPPQLPSSSGNIGVPEESIPHLFSVYSFLRSYSIQLFLSPFKLDDFVGSLNCRSANTLIDAVHFSLLRILRRHLETLSSDGAKHASECLRRLDWSLLDTLTWSVYLVEYLVIMEYAKGSEWQGFYADVLDGEYYSISVDRKLMILQILCDDVLESAELRVEVDMRGSLEEGVDVNGTANPLPPLNGPRRIHPKYSKTSACKDLVAVNEKNGISTSAHGTNLGEKVAELDTIDVDQDENSDECQLCGMDGTLLCCDGCPSAYHARCIGLNKMLIPDGLWFCPECTTKKVEPTLRISEGYRGAEIFGTDPYGQVFVGICNHLLVLNISTGAVPSCRYYVRDDIPKVFQVLWTTEQHKKLYSGICNSIMQFWEIPEGSVFPLSGGAEAENAKGENLVSTVTLRDNRILSRQENDCQEMPPMSTSLETMDQGSHPVLLDSISAPKPFRLSDSMPCVEPGTESLMSSGLINHYRDNSSLMQQSCVDQSTGLHIDTGVPKGNGDSYKNFVEGNEDGGKKVTADVLLPANNDTLNILCEKGEGKSTGANELYKRDGPLYMGNHFKPQSYINQYFLGDIAASAAANFAVLASEGNGVAEAHASSNPRKMVSANMALQLKAFIPVSIRFIWPNSEKKVVEVPRERCGWCLSCKANVSSKKGCLLNLAASNAIKGSARNISGLRPAKNGEGSFPGIATYMLYMMESLRGLLVGNFLGAHYRKRWRKEVEEASNCSTLKFCLLELEEHIRPIAFSGDWVKLVDDWMVESSAVQSTCTVGAPPKRPGRRKKNQTAVSEVAPDLCDSDLRLVRWWRGGKLAKMVFQKGILPCPIIRKAARQGGRKKIYGIYYAEGSEIPKRSRRCAWRAAVEMSKNAPQLALQVRYLDLHLRWSEMSNSEQNSYDSKGTESDTSAYRNARICDKKVEENKIKYGLIFDQKHLSSRIMKNIVNEEQNEDGEKIFWFSEAHVPLFLVKEYEQKAEDLSPPAKASNVLSRMQRKQLKASRRNIFSYLMNKEEKVDKCSCGSCQEDLLLRDAVKCNDCEGYCHKDCSSHATVDMKAEVDYAVTCNRCLHNKAIILNDNVCKTPVGQLLRQGQEYKMVAGFVKGPSMNCDSLPSVSAENSETRPLIKTASSSRNVGSKGKRSLTYGLIWKKKNIDESGTDFRLRNILLKGNGEVDPSNGPKCYLCCKPYDQSLMYIRCGDCQFWYHADAVQLKESQIFDLVGFKCSKCRRTRMPPCPYADSESRKPRMDPESRKSRADSEYRKSRADSENRKSRADSENRKALTKAPKQRNTVMEPGSRTTLKPPMGWKVPTTTGSVVEPGSEITPTPPMEWELLATTGSVVEPGSEMTPNPATGWELPTTTGSVVEPGSGTTLKPPTGWELPTTAGSVKMEEGKIEEADPLLFSLSRVEPIPEITPDFNGEWDTTGVSVQAPQKLPIRRQVKLENDSSNQKLSIREHFNEDSGKAENFGYEDVKFDDMEFEPQTYFGNGSPPRAEWGLPVEGIESDEMFEGEFGPQDMEYEPQTYFSYTELLAPDGVLSNLGDESAAMSDDWADPVAFADQDFNPPEQYGAGTTNNHEEFNEDVDSAVNVSCQMCSRARPAPDLFCEVCGLWMHKQCSPWEESTFGDTWRCGNCRDWA